MRCGSYVHAEACSKTWSTNVGIVCNNIFAAAHSRRLLKATRKLRLSRSLPESHTFCCRHGRLYARASDNAPESRSDFSTASTQADNLLRSALEKKIKTTGDAYMAVSGVPEKPCPIHAAALADLALDIQENAARLGRTQSRAVRCASAIARALSWQASSDRQFF